MSMYVPQSDSDNVLVFRDVSGMQDLVGRISLEAFTQCCQDAKSTVWRNCYIVVVVLVMDLKIKTFWRLERSEVGGIGP